MLSSLYNTATGLSLLDTSNLSARISSLEAYQTVQENQLIAASNELNNEIINNCNLLLTQIAESSNTLAISLGNTCNVLQNEISALAASVSAFATRDSFNQFILVQGGIRYPLDLTASTWYVSGSVEYGYDTESTLAEGGLSAANTLWQADANGSLYYSGDLYVDGDLFGQSAYFGAPITMPMAYTVGTWDYATNGLGTRSNVYIVGSLRVRGSIFDGPSTYNQVYPIEAPLYIGSCNIVNKAILPCHLSDSTYATICNLVLPASGQAGTYGAYTQGAQSFQLPIIGVKSTGLVGVASVATVPIPDTQSLCNYLLNDIASASNELAGNIVSLSNSVLGTVNGNLVSLSNSLLGTVNGNLVSLSNNLLGTIDGNLVSLSNNLLGTIDGNLVSLSNSLLGTVNGDLISLSNSLLGTIDGNLVSLSNSLLGTVNGNLVSLSNSLLGTVNGDLISLSNSLLGTVNGDLISLSNSVLGTVNGELITLSNAYTQADAALSNQLVQDTLWNAEYTPWMQTADGIRLRGRLAAAQVIVSGNVITGQPLADAIGGQRNTWQPFQASAGIVYLTGNVYTDSLATTFLATGSNGTASGGAALIPATADGAGTPDKLWVLGDVIVGSNVSLANGVSFTPANGTLVIGASNLSTECVHSWAIGSDVWDTIANNLATTSNVLAQTTYNTAISLSNAMGGNLATTSNVLAQTTYDTGISLSNALTGNLATTSNILAQTTYNTAISLSNTLTAAYQNADATLSNYLISQITTTSGLQTLSNALVNDIAASAQSLSNNLVGICTNATNLTTGTLNAALLPSSGATAGTYGSSSAVPVLTVDATGRITSASTASLASTWSVNGSTLYTNNSVSIGTSASFAPLYITSTASAQSGTAWYYGYNTNSAYSGVASFSIICGGNIGASGIYLTSDRRIKKDITTVNNNDALDRVRNLQAVSYKYIDRAQGDTTAIGYVAQDVASVVPEAVSTQTGYLPDIYRLCDVSTADNGYIINAPEISHNDLVKLVLEAGGEIIVKASSVDPRGFFVSKAGLEPGLQRQLETGRVFVYGRQDQIQHIDYRSLFVLGLAAIKRLEERIEALEKATFLLERDGNLR